MKHLTADDLRNVADFWDNPGFEDAEVKANARLIAAAEGGDA